jgi:hypothetical protein
MIASHQADIAPSRPAKREGHCVVCDALLPRSFKQPAPPPDPYPSCQAVACRMVVSRRADMGEAGFRHYLQMQARHTQHRAAVARAALERKAAEAGENAAAFAALRARLPTQLAAEPLQLLLPNGPARASRVGAERRARYREHLLDIIAEAGLIAAGPPVAMPAATPAASPSLMPGKVCGICRGGCCTRGAEKAYLSAETMRRVLDAQPALSAQQLLDTYLERVPDKAQSGSCINHTARGCSLPTDLRSDICNRFSCEPLARLQAAQREGVPVQAVLIVRRKQDHWRRNEAAVDNRVNALAVLRATGVQRVAITAEK